MIMWNQSYDLGRKIAREPHWHAVGSYLILKRKTQNSDLTAAFSFLFYLFWQIMKKIADDGIYENPGMI